MILYHRNTPENPRAILADGFRDMPGNWNTYGVWFSNYPLDANEGAKGRTLLRLTLPHSKRELRQYDRIEAGKPYREWQIPAALVNEHRTALVVIEL